MCSAAGWTTAPGRPATLLGLPPHRWSAARRAARLVSRCTLDSTTSVFGMPRGASNPGFYLFWRQRGRQHAATHRLDGSSGGVPTPPPVRGELAASTMKSCLDDVLGCVPCVLVWLMPPQEPIPRGCARSSARTSIRLFARTIVGAGSWVRWTALHRLFAAA